MANKNIRINGFVPKSNVMNIDQIEVDFSYKKSMTDKVCALGASDVGIIDLPVAVLRIYKFETIVGTAEGDTLTCDVGYTGSTAYFHNDLDFNSAATTASSANVVTIDNTAADKYITITPSAACDTAKATLIMHYIIIDR